MSKKILCLKGEREGETEYAISKLQKSAAVSFQHTCFERYAAWP